MKAEVLSTSLYFYTWMEINYFCRESWCVGICSYRIWTASKKWNNHILL